MAQSSLSGTHRQSNLMQAQQHSSPAMTASFMKVIMFSFVELFSRVD